MGEINKVRWRKLSRYQGVQGKSSQTLYFLKVSKSLLSDINGDFDTNLIKKTKEELIERMILKKKEYKKKGYEFVGGGFHVGDSMTAKKMQDDI